LKSKALKTLKLFLIFSSLIILLFSFLAITQLNLIREKLKKNIIKAINNNLNTKIYVNDLKIGILETFPDLNLSLKNVTILSSNTFNKSDFLINTDTLLKSEEIIIRFDIIKALFQDSFVLKKVLLKNSNLNIYFDTKENNNFQILKETKASTNNLTLKLSNFKLEQFKARIFYLPDKLKFYLDGKNFLLKGNFFLNEYELFSLADLFIERIIINDRKINFNSDLELELKIKKLKDLIKVNNSKIKFFDVELNTLATFELSKNKKFNIIINSKKIKIQDFTKKLLKKFNIDFLKRFAFSGILDINIKIGKQSLKQSKPYLESKLMLKNTTIAHKTKDINLQNFNAKITLLNYNILSLKNSNIIFDTLYFEIDNKQVSSKILIKNLEKPFIKSKLKGSISLNSLTKIFDIDYLIPNNGEIYFDITTNGKIKNFKTINDKDLKNLNISGKAVLKNFSYTYKDPFYNISNLNGEFYINKNKEKTNNLKFKLNNTDIELKGEFDNLLYYILFDNYNLKTNAEIYIPTLDLKNFSQNDSNSFTLPDNILLNSKIRIDKLINNNIEIKNINSNINGNGKYYNLENLSFRFLDSKAKCNVYIQNHKENKALTIKILGEIDELDIKETFKIFNNFNQSYLTHNNISGIMNLKVNNLAFKIDSLSKIEENSIISDFIVYIKRSKLENFEPLEKLAKYISLDELKSIKISDVEGNIFIANEKIIFPQLNLKTSAFEIDVSGEHNFNNEYKYNIKLYLKDWLGRKARSLKRENELYGIVENEVLGSTSIYLTLIGKSDKYEFLYDNKKTIQQAVQTINSEVKEIKSVLKTEFGIFKKDTAIKEIEKKHKPLKYKIEWED